jgi:uncharacterized membrane protein YhaH (DUF805 family)
MSWRDFLFSFKGRFNRAKYWLFVLIYIVEIIVVVIPAVALSAVNEAAAGIFVVVMIIALIIPTIVASLAVGVKRLHDRNKSGWWLLLFYLVPSILSGMAEAVSPATGELTATGGLLTVISVVLSLWGFVELAILRGTRGPNKYGPDPLESPAETAAAFD